MPCKRIDCKYHRKMHGYTGLCNYLVETGLPRGCDVENCDKYEVRTPKDNYTKSREYIQSLYKLNQLKKKEGSTLEDELNKQRQRDNW